MKRKRPARSSKSPARTPASPKSAHRPTIDCELQHPTLSVRDVPDAVEFYTQKLGFTLGFLWGNPPVLAGVNLGDVSIHLAKGTPNPKGCSIYFVVGDADELHAFHQANGVKVILTPADRPYELRDYRIRDLHGYELSFGHRLQNCGPAVEIERVNLSVRLEKRLAAALRDLAGHKGMSLGGCLEETLLHTFEPLGNGVASPHTKSTLRYIQELKRRHGIDYDTHASYRFVEKRKKAKGSRG